MNPKEEFNFMLNDFEENSIMNEKDIPRSINVIGKTLNNLT